MAEPREDIGLHQLALSALGFILGLILTALALILNSPASFRVSSGGLRAEQYDQTLVTYVARVGALSGVGMLAFLDVGGGLSARGGFVDRFGTVLFFLSVLDSWGSSRWFSPRSPGPERCWCSSPSSCSWLPTSSVGASRD